MNGYQNIIIMGILVGLMGGCAHSQPVATMEEFKKAQSRSYQGLSPKQIYNAAKEVFLLADPNDVKFSYDQDRFVARRYGVMFVVLAFSTYEEVWTIDAKETNNAVEVTVAVDPKMDGVTFPPNGIGPYVFFYSRLEYMLGRSETWMTCQDYEMGRRENPKWGEHAEYLCFLADDNVPKGPLARAE